MSFRWFEALYIWRTYLRKMDKGGQWTSHEAHMTHIQTSWDWPSPAGEVLHSPHMTWKHSLTFSFSTFTKVGTKYSQHHQHALSPWRSYNESVHIVLSKMMMQYNCNHTNTEYTYKTMEINTYTESIIIMFPHNFIQSNACTHGVRANKVNQSLLCANDTHLGYTSELRVP